MNEFLSYLKSLALSPKSFKNYKSDVSHFAGWAIMKIRSFGSYVESLADIVPFLNSKLILDYREYLNGNAVPPKTINRRLSTLRHFSRHLVASQVLDFDFMSGIENISQSKKVFYSSKPLAEAFRSHLMAEKASANTIKNYMSDVQQFLTWLETKQETLNSKL
jgi:site-specific recombinase XerD